jgi:serine/threonine-protein kinase
MNLNGHNSPPSLGRRLGNFELLEQIGEDAAGAIYRARVLDSNETVLLRVLNPIFSHDPAFRDQFYQLVKIVTDLRHPNLATITHGGETEESFFIASENHDGESLADWVSREGALPEKTAVGAALCVASALAHVWTTAQLFHGNLAPQRIFVDDNGDVKLFDLALPEQSDPSSRYAAPEILRADPDADFRADIFSLGLILYFAVTAQTPFDTKTLKTRVALLETDQLPDPRQFTPKLSDAFCRVLQKMLARNPADRFADWQQVESALSDLLADTTPAVAPIAPDKTVLRINEKKIETKSAAPQAAVVHLSLAAVPAPTGTTVATKPAIPIIPAAAPIVTETASRKKSSLLPTLWILAAAALLVMAAVWGINTYRVNQLTQAPPQTSPPPAQQPPPAPPPQAPPENPPALAANPQPPQNNPEPRNDRPQRGFQDNERGRNRQPQPQPPPQQPNAASPLLPLLGGVLDALNRRNEALEQALNPNPVAPAPKPPSPEELKRAEEERLAAERLAQQQAERARVAAAFNKFAVVFLDALARRQYSAALDAARAAASDPALEPMREHAEQCAAAAERLDAFLKSLPDRLARAQGRSISWGGASGVITEVADGEIVLDKGAATIAVRIADGSADDILALAAPLPTSTAPDPWLNVAWFSFAEGKPAVARAHLNTARKNGVDADAIAHTMSLLSLEFAELEAETLLAQLRDAMQARKFASARAVLDKLKESFAATKMFRAALDQLRPVETMLSFHEGLAAAPSNSIFLTLQNPATVTALAFSADGRYFAAASDNAVRVWELATGQVRRELTSADGRLVNISFVALSADNRFLLAKSQQHHVTLWDVASAKPVLNFPTQLYAAAFAPNGKFLAYVSTSAPTEVRLLDLASFDNERVLKSASAARQIQHLAITADARHIVIIANDRSVQIFDVAALKSVRSFSLPQQFVTTSAALSADAKRLLLSATDRSLRVFDTETGKELRAYDNRSTAAIRSAYSPDGRFALTIYDGHKMTLTDTADSGGVWHTVEPNKIPIKAVALSPDRRLAITASELKIQVWKLWDTDDAPAAKK